MADSAVSVTEGSGKDVDTRTESTNGNHRQVIVVGDPAANAGVAPVDGTAGLKVDLGADNDVVVSDGGGSVTVDGTVAATQSGTWNVATLTGITNVVHIDDNSSTVSIDDGAGSITVDGTVAVSGTVTVDSELTTGDLDTGAGTDTRAVVGLVGSKSGGGVLIPGDATKGLAVDLTATGANTTALKVDGSAVTQPVSDSNIDVALSTRLKPADTLTKVTTVDTITNVVHVDDNSSTISVDDGAGSLTVDGTVAATQSGTWTVQPGNTANTTAWKVDGSAVTQPVSGTVAVTNSDITTIAGAVRAEDAASADGHTGIAALAVRKATPANTSGTDGDYENLQVSAGRLWASATIDAALPAGTNAIGKLAANDGVDVGDVTVNNASGASAVNIQDGGNSITVDGTVGVSGTVTVDSELTTADLDTGAGTDTRAVIGLAGAASGGAVLVQATSGGALKGDVTTIAGTAPSTAGKIDVKAADGDVFVRQATASNLNAQVVGTIAHDGVDSGNPVKVGFKAETSPKGITLVADGDRTDAYADSDGILMVKLNTSFGDIVSERVTDTGGTSTAFSNFTAVASTKNYVTAITVYNSSATAGTVDFRDGTAGSVLWTMPVPAGGGSVIASAQPLFKTSANTALAYDVSGALSTVTISVSGFQSKV